MTATISRRGRRAPCAAIALYLLLGNAPLPTLAAAVPISMTETQVALLWPLCLGAALFVIACIALALWLRLRKVSATAERHTAALESDNSKIHRQLLSCNTALSDSKRHLEAAYKKIEQQRQENSDLLAIAGHHLRQPLDALHDTLRLLVHSNGAERDWLQERAQRQLQTARRSLEEMRNWGQVESAVLQPPPEQPSDATALSILLVESDNNQSLYGALRARGHRVQRENNGLDATNAALTKPFDLVLIDSHLPLMDGVEATRKIRRHRGSELPIFALLKAPRPGDRARYQAQGLSGVLARPVSEKQLQQLLKWVQRRRGECADQIKKARTARRLDTDTLLRQRDALGYRQFTELVNERASTLPKRITALTSALTGRHWLDAEQQACAIAASAEEVGLEAIAIQLRELASRLRIDSERESCRKQRTELLNLMRTSVQALKSWQEQSIQTEREPK